MSLSLTVIIPVFEDWRRLQVCLDALEAQTLSPEAFEVIVVNNEPGGESPPLAVRSNVRIIREPRPGSYAARNAAAALANGPYLAFTDSDCVPAPDWLDKGLAALEKHSGSRIAGAISIFREPGGSGSAYIYDLHAAFRQRERAATGVCVTANMLVPRSVFEAVGPFEERMSGGDFEWNRRAGAAGIPIVYREDVKVGHPARRSLREIFRKKRRTAGSSYRDVSLRLVVSECFKPPLRRFMMLRQDRVPLNEALLVFLILWAGRFVRAYEILLVRCGARKPTRS